MPSRMKPNIRKCGPNLHLVAVDEKRVKGVWARIQPFLVFCLQLGMNRDRTRAFAK